MRKIIKIVSLAAIFLFTPGCAVHFLAPMPTVVHYTSGHVHAHTHFDCRHYHNGHYVYYRRGIIVRKHRHRLHLHNQRLSAHRHNRFKRNHKKHPRHFRRH